MHAVDILTMAPWFLLILPLFALGESQPTYASNATDLQAAMADMRTQSYHGFVILLKILNSMPNSLPSTDVTFLMPDDEELSQFSSTLDRLHDFILSHSFPAAIMLGHLLRLPNGTLVPSSIPTKMINITNRGKSGLFVNNARITMANVCQRSSSIRCHGISAALTYGNGIPVLQGQDTKDNSSKSVAPKPSPTVKQMGALPPL